MNNRDVKRAILDAMLAHVPFDGWTEKSLRAAARDTGRDAAEVRLLFPQGVRDALVFFMEEADQAMLQAAEAMDLPAMKIRERIAALVKARIMALEPNREAARRASLILGLPGYQDLALSSLYRTVDLIWQAAGDTSTDWNFYTKRLILSGVYTSTLLYWLGDHSEDYADTWDFLDRRIEDVMRFEKTKAEIRKSVENLPSVTRFLGRLRHPPIRPL